MLADQQEHPCQTIDMSPGGVALIAPVLGQIGERVICYLDHFGRIEGRISRHLEGGFALELTAPASKREKIADQLTWHANRNALGVPEGRHHERIIPRKTATTLTLADGRVYPAGLIDISISGAALFCEVKPKIGTSVTLGQRPSRVARVSERSLAVEFMRLIPREHFDDQIEL